VIASVCTLGAILAYRHQLHIPYNRETLLGLALGLLALDRLSRCARKDLDEALGNLSYGVFLNHFFVKWMFFGGAVSSAGSVIAYLALSLGIAFGIYSMVEKPAHGFRKQLRGYKAGFAFKADAANPLT
jgi:peptidoglycan/LPS O-acetylase OafA/YrhL